MTGQVIEGAFDAYFHGLPPFKEPKVRKDLPDAFVFYELKKLADDLTGESLHIVVEDGALGAACQGDGLPVFETLREFLDLPEVQGSLTNAVISENKSDVLEAVMRLSSELEPLFLDSIEKSLLDEGVFGVSGDELPGETGEAWITGIYSPYALELSEIDHLGAGVFALFFEAKVELEYEFSVFRSDIFEYDQEKYSFSYCNDHYMDATTTDPFKVYGRLDLDFGESLLGCSNLDEVARSLSDPKITVDEFLAFELLREEC